MRINRTLTFLLLFTCSLRGEIDWAAMLEKYSNPDSAGDRYLRESFFELAATEDPKAIEFFLEFYNDPPNTNTSWGQSHPDIRRSQTYRGLAHVALVQLGHEPAADKLIEEILHADHGGRLVAFRKAVLLEGEVGIELLSYFIGDRRVEEGGPLWVGERAAVKELSKRVENPPVSMEESHDSNAYYKGDGRKAWLKWRYDKFGPIPGREELFTQFATSSDQEGSDVASEAVEVSERATTPEPEIEEPAEVVVTEPIEEDVEQSPNWWLWLVGIVVVVGGVFVLRSRK
jgi:hypothetical protein